MSKRGLEHYLQQQVQSKSLLLHSPSTSLGLPSQRKKKRPRIDQQHTYPSSTAGTSVVIQNSNSNSLISESDSDAVDNVATGIFLNQEVSSDGVHLVSDQPEFQKFAQNLIQTMVSFASANIRLIFFSKFVGSATSATK
jgi:hypothetical protein